MKIRFYKPKLVTYHKFYDTTYTFKNNYEYQWSCLNGKTTTAGANGNFWLVSDVGPGTDPLKVNYL